MIFQFSLAFTWKQHSKLASECCFFNHMSFSLLGRRFRLLCKEDFFECTTISVFRADCPQEEATMVTIDLCSFLPTSSLLLSPLLPAPSSHDSPSSKHLSGGWQHRLFIPFSDFPLTQPGHGIPPSSQCCDEIHAKWQATSQHGERLCERREEWMTLAATDKSLPSEDTTSLLDNLRTSRPKVTHPKQMSAS